MPPFLRFKKDIPSPAGVYNWGLRIFSFLRACRGDWRSGWMGKRSACSFPFAVFGDDGYSLKAKIRTILENNPAGLLWCGGYIYFGRKVLYDLVYYQQVMTILENKKGKDFWSLK